MIFDKIFFKALKIKWFLMKVVGTMGGVGIVGVVGVARVVGWWEFSERLGVFGVLGKELEK